MQPFLFSLKDDARMRLPSAVPDMREILRGMSIASDTHDEFVTADDYYIEPQHDDYDDERASNVLDRVSSIYRLFFVYFIHH